MTPASFAGQHAAEITDLLAKLTELRQQMTDVAAQAAEQLTGVDPTFRASALNLLHYLGLRQHDLRAVQQRLTMLGLSSLGRAEAHALASVDAVLAVLHALAQTDGSANWPSPDAPDFANGGRLLARHTEAVLGPPPAGRDVRIMVTLPTEAATDYNLMRELLRQGTDCVRINCAHDDATVWQQMIAQLRRAEQETGKLCKICMDLAGVKLRTADLPKGPSVLRLSPVRDDFGLVLAPVRVWLTGPEQPAIAPAPTATSLVFPAAWLEGLHSGEAVRFRDARGKKRKLRIRSTSAQGCWAELRKTAYLAPDTEFFNTTARAAVQHLPHQEAVLILRVGDALELAPSPDGRAEPESLVPVIGCSMPEVLAQVKTGERIWFDDGKIGGVVERAEAGTLLVRITQARVSGGKLRNDKGINLPDTKLPLSTLTPQDLADLPFIAQQADMVGYSFASSARDVEELRQQLARLTDRPVPIILKIETQRGFEQLPALLLGAMQASSFGVMIARGDLAVECGFERLAEVQEEILWLCEAAHVPVIWATQVLESLASGGLPSRAEVTDAAMSDRAECVMLNKGPRVVQAVQTLDGILRRMQAHQYKKSAMLRSLHVAQLAAPVAEVATSAHGAAST